MTTMMIASKKGTAPPSQHCFFHSLELPLRETEKVTLLFHSNVDYSTRQHLGGCLLAKYKDQTWVAISERTSVHHCNEFALEDVLRAEEIPIARSIFFALSKGNFEVPLVVVDADDDGTTMHMDLLYHYWRDDAASSCAKKYSSTRLEFVWAF